MMEAVVSRGKNCMTYYINSTLATYIECSQMVDTNTVTLPAKNLYITILASLIDSTQI